MTYANVNRVFTALQTILNKQQLGFVSPTQFNVLARVAQGNIFDEKIDQIINGVVKTKMRNLTSVGDKTTHRAEDDLITLFVYNESLTPSGGTNNFAYPTSCHYVQGLRYQGNEVDRIPANKASYYVNSYYTPPTDVYPIAVIDRSKIEVIGTTLVDPLYIDYYKAPVGSKDGAPSLSYPTYAYTVIGENQVYNSAASYDFELPSHLEHEIVMEMASLLGINMRDGEVINYAENKMQKDQLNETAR